MTRPIDLRILNLIAARLCHDFIGPVAAISNGAELLADEEPEFIRDAVALVGDSARKASRRLQFYRFAYAFSGGGLGGPPPHQLVTEYFQDGPVECDYRAEMRSLSPEVQQLACVMLALAGEALPRGGRLILSSAEGCPLIEATGQATGPSEQLRAAMSLETPTAELTSRTVGGYFAGLLAEALGWRLAVSDREGGFSLAAAAL